MRILINLRVFVLFLLFLSRAEADLDMSFGYSAYLTHTSLERQLNHYMDIGLDFTHYNSVGFWFYGAELVSSFSLDESHQNYLTIPDLFIAYGRSNILNNYNFSVVFGRQKRLDNTTQKSNGKESDYISLESWSFMDEVWDLGLWQGRINWDYLQSRQQGLIGSFFTIEKEPWLLTFFLSGLFLPDAGPSVDIKNGKIESGSRWFVPPQSEFVIFSQKFEALYWLQKPYLKNVILNDSIAARFRFGSQESQWFSLAYARKPVNQVYFKIYGGFSIDKKAVNSVIHYQSFKHSLVSLDFGLKKHIFKTVFSVIQELPHRPQMLEGWIIPILPKALFFSSYLELNLEPYHLPVRLLNFNFLYSHFVDQKGEIDKENQLAMDLSAHRFKLYYGFSLSAYSRSFQWNGQSFSMGLSYWYSIPEDGGWLKTSLKWHITPEFSLESSVDILGVNNEEIKGFFNLYKHNDRVQIKVTYAIN